MMIAPGTVTAAPVQLLRTANYESPVRGGPDDLLMIAGYGFDSGDRVVYAAQAQAAQAQNEPPGQRAPAVPHPPTIPSQSTATLGVAPIVQIGDPAYAVTVRLPEVLAPQRIYRLWVVNAAGEWSEPVTLNDPRPLWVTPAFAYESTDFAGLNRGIRVVGRNLDPDPAAYLWIRLRGPETYRLKSDPAGKDAPLDRFVAAGTLPPRLRTGSYAVGVSRDGVTWQEIAGQRLEIRSDPAPLPQFELSDSRFGGCAPDDGKDDGRCLALAVEAAGRAGGGVVVIPAGTWDFSPAAAARGSPGDGLLLPPNVHLQGLGPQSSRIVRHHAQDSAAPGALLTLSGRNSIAGLAFTDADRFESLAETRPIIQLGTVWGLSQEAVRATPAIDTVVISNDSFLRVGRAIVDSGLPLRHLFITHDEFGAYDNALLLTGNRFLPSVYRIDDSVIRGNRFVPGSFLDIRGATGTAASQLGASLRLDFSENVADGTSTEGLQSPEDPRGWRAGFFWNTANNHEFLLISQNRISCAGDKAGAGEAIVADDNANTPAFNGAATVTATGPDWITVRGKLLTQQDGHPVATATFYAQHWIQVVQGPGLGQVRRIVSYVEDPANSTVTFHVAPAWDVPPRALETRVGAGRQYWQVYTVANEVEQRAPPCQKSNLSGPSGGQIAYWAPTADSAIEGNSQFDTSGIQFQQAYSVRSPACKECGTSLIFQTALEVRGNSIDGEYNWQSDCSESGITGSFAASPTPESPPSVLSFGVVIAHNTISRADGFKGGGIDIASSWYRGPPPQDWPLVQNMLIYGNALRDISGPTPLPLCRRPMAARIGIRLDGPDNIRDTVLYENSCERVDVGVEDGGRRTATPLPSAPASSNCNKNAIQRAP